MGFNIKNNYGPNIEVNDGGRLTLVQGTGGLWHTASAEEAAYEEVRENIVNEGEMPFDGENTAPQLAIPERKTVKIFRFQNDFVKNNVADVIRNHYKGSHANLALIEITLYDHKQLIKRNCHKAFVKALAAWNLIEAADEEELKKIVSAVADKHKRMPKVGYREWGGNHAGDKSFCEKIGRDLGDSMPYNG